MDGQVRQLRMVRWGVRCTLALGIAASLGANILHAHHQLIDRVIAAWPPLAVFVTIEVIARVPIRTRWLAALRLVGLVLVTGIALWVSYWHMASVAATHGETGARYLLPLSVDGLVLVSSVSLVELANQIGAAQAATTVQTVTGAPPADAPRAPVPAVVPHPRQAEVAAAGVACAAAPPDLADTDHDAAGAAVAVRGGAGEPVAVTPDEQAGAVPAAPAAPAVPASDGPDPMPTPPATATGQPVPPADEAADRPPTDPVDAVAYWMGKDPTLSFQQLGEKIGRSERTARRIIKNLSDAAAPNADPEGPDPAAAPDGRGTNGVNTELADPIVSGPG